jgi:hypothetical protein
MPTFNDQVPGFSCQITDRCADARNRGKHAPASKNNLQKITESVRYGIYSAGNVLTVSDK